MPTPPASSVENPADLDSAMTPDQKKQNLRLALILASIAVIFFIGFVGRAAFFGI